MTATKVKRAPKTSSVSQRTGLLLPGDWERLQAQAASSKFLLPVGTHWVERDVFGIADEINARWPNLRVASCGCGHCITRGHAPHAVLEHCKDGQTRPVFEFTRFGRDIIDRLHAMHTSQDPLAQHEAHNLKVRAELEAKQAEKRAADLEVAEDALRSTKINYRHDGVEYTPHGPRKIR